MHKLRHHLPSANLLFTFEAAARRQSFTAAAEELNVSQPAVSKMIAQFETALGFRLFHRQTRPLALTAEGKRLHQEVARCLDTLAASIAAMAQAPGRETVRASFSAAFLQLWLLPRLGEFTAAFPGIRLSLEESSQDEIDLHATGIEISARLGQGDWPEVEARELVPEVIFPVAHPGYVAQQGGSASDLSRARLLHFRERHRVRLGWRDWFAAEGADPAAAEETVVFSDALGALGAARLGHGVALGWGHLVLDQVLAGDLVQIGPRRLASGQSVYLITPRRHRLSAAAVQFHDWLLGRMAADRAAHPWLFAEAAGL